MYVILHGVNGYDIGLGNKYYNARFQHVLNLMQINVDTAEHEMWNIGWHYKDMSP